jgi:polysaccharide deacetylase 2 family uncharacterized protein YibQ
MLFRAQQRFAPFLQRRACIFPLAVVAIAMVLFGCEKKPQPLNANQVRAITRELVYAAKNASGGRVETGMFPERPQTGAVTARGSIPGLGPTAQNQPPPPPDLIFITLPEVEGGGTDEAVQAAVVKEMDRVALFHQLARVQRDGAPGLFRFDFFFAGQRTHTVNIVTPVVKAPRPDLASASRAKLAIIIDDLGYDRETAEAVFQMPFPLTVSVLPHLPHSAEIAEEASRRGFQVMLHLPIEANDDIKAESVELRPGMQTDQVARVVQQMLETVPQAVGVNNHQGSLGTSDAGLMNAIMPALRERDLFFVDSRTASTTVAYAAAHQAHVPSASRDVFLDDSQDPADIRRQLDQAIRDARLHGAAVSIGHPHPATLQVLSEELPRLQKEGVNLVFASQVVH